MKSEGCIQCAPGSCTGACESKNTATTRPCDPRKREDWKGLTRDFQQVLLLGAILDKLEEIRCGLIVVGSEVQNVKETVRND